MKSRNAPVAMGCRVIGTVQCPRDLSQKERRYIRALIEESAEGKMTEEKRKKVIRLLLELRMKNQAKYYRRMGEV